MMTWLALWAIGFYQRHLSPYKGFRCAYAAHTGRAGCSGLGRRAIRRFGFWRGGLVLEARLHKCGVAYRRCQAPRALAGQAGFLDCDLPCGCDLPSPGKLGDCAGDLLSCDFGYWRRRADEDQQVKLPPRKGQRRDP